MRNHLFICSFVLFLGACVSVQLPGGKSTPAEDVEYAAPAAPYKLISTNSADRAWLSASTGNTISFLSECGANDPSLQQMETETLSALNSLKIIETKDLSFNGRAARQTVAQGKVDGVPVQILVIIFKKNGCNYTLSYGGIEKNFQVEAAAFESFKQSFKAP